MKEIIKVKKDIIFNTKIGEITNINLDHDYKVKEDLIEGSISLSGSYKMTEASVIEEEFFYKIPFGVSIPDNIKKNSIHIDIDDFKYEINKEVLSVDIDLELCCEEEKHEIKDEVLEYENEEFNINEVNNDISYNEEINNITNNIITNDNKYCTYKVYIVRENDTIEEICKKYNVSIDDIKDYNDITNININDKIIIPYINE